MVYAAHLVAPIALGVLIVWVGLRTRNGRPVPMLEPLIVSVILLAAGLALVGASVLVGLIKLGPRLGGAYRRLGRAVRVQAPRVVDSLSHPGIGYDSESCKEQVESGGEELLAMWWKPPVGMSAVLHPPRADAPLPRADAPLLGAAGVMIPAGHGLAGLHNTLWMEYLTAPTGHARAIVMACIADLAYGEQPPSKN